MKTFFRITISALCVSLLAACTQNAPQKVIFDTDMGNDIDDAIALAMLFNYEKQNALRLAAVAVNKDNPYAAPYVKMFASYYGRSDLPVAAVRDGKTRESGIFIQKILEERGFKADSFGTFPEPTALMRKILTESEDASVVYISVGFSTNLARLLASAPDEISPLSGAELFEKKVKYVSVMAGEFDITFANPSSPYLEYNVTNDVPSAKFVFETCPVPIIFSGFEIGKAVEFPHAKIKSDFAQDNPLVSSYDLYATMVNKGKAIEHNRPSWDLTSVLYVVEPDAFALSKSGNVRVTERGGTLFTPDSTGLSRYLILDGSHSAASIKDKLIKAAAQK